MPNDIHPEDLKAEIRKTCGSMAELSTSKGYQRDAVRKTLRNPWPAVERIIADALEAEPQTLWPSRYDEEGLPKTARTGPHNSTRSGTGNV